MLRGTNRVARYKLNEYIVESKGFERVIEIVG